MAKRKGTSTGRKRAAPRKTSGRKAVAKKPAKKARAAARNSKKTARGVRKGARKTAPRVRKPTARKAVARKPVRRKAVVRKRVARKAVARKGGSFTPRKAPALDRARRTVQGDDIVQTPPSSLNMDRAASAVRTGRREMLGRLQEHTETSPALTAGDVDADWEGAYSSGDEAPGGDNPTPDQGVVDDIGKAVGVQYDDNEELKGEAKITKRDKHRWELDPASAEDYKDH